MTLHVIPLFLGAACVSSQLSVFLVQDLVPGCISFCNHSSQSVSGMPDHELMVVLQWQHAL